MQLNPRAPGQIRGRLAAMACGLVGAAASPVDAVEVSSAGLVYSEPGRVTAIEGVGSLRTELGRGKLLTVQGSVDALTGASPNGAMPSRFVQTFTRSSGGGSYTIAPGKTPVDDSFSDQRYAGSATLDWLLGRLTRIVTGASYSTEADYEAIGVNGRIAQDLFRRNTTVSLGFSRSFDTVSPVGGVPVALASMRRAGLPQPKEGSEEDKTVTDVVGGVTQVIDASTVVQANYSFHRTAGYLTDPYKLISVVQAEEAVSPGTPFDYLYESRPGTRTQHALYGEGRRSFDWNVLTLSYRYLWDDWGVRSHTIHGRYHWELTRSRSLEPELRYYRQTAVDFYSHSLVDRDPLPEHVSADARLAEMSTVTVALRYALRLPEGRRMALKLGYYRRWGESHPADALGALRDQDLFPTMNAIISQVSFSLGD